ncbi:formate dehydrogenase accessory protein FdhE [Oecophyllibacter saccharovorans]|uniref:formate dehydrogenase accessory protein FdhE n=1 Tax=Oecophyllibacter saccharovorans TaxID=2558360 RepID=UPI001144DD46|nr:formate dehydrogenase accessory protein FdhE [Oecophyllibacter saccharovorans]QDH14901.1 formate dehydrogenase accessory protein FdhE [Oecophyllibacter saccharovorans]
MTASSNRPAPPLPSDVPVPPEERTGGIVSIDPVLSPDLKALYERRITRLAALEEKAGEDGGNYLAFLRHLVELQARQLEQAPLSPQDMATMAVWLNSTVMPSAEALAEAPFWQEIFRTFIAELAPSLPVPQAEALQQASRDVPELARQAHLLLTGNFSEANQVLAVPLFAVLSLCWAQGASMLLATEEARKARAEPEAVNCPCCGALAVASLVMTGGREGLRYQECSLCETRWHRVRSLCTVCGESGKLNYWSLDEQKAPVEVETCGDCLSYVKLIRLDRDPQQEGVADDLGTFPLDSLIGEKSFTRSTINPFALPL